VQLGLVAVIVAFGAPFLWSVVAAFDREPTRTWPWPRTFTLEHFRYLFTDLHAGDALRNSLVVAGSTMVIATLAAMLAGYGLSRLRVRGKTAIAYGVLLLQSFPLAITMVPIYDLAIRLQLQDTYTGLVLAHSAVVLPLLVWLMKGFVDAVPLTMEEEAWVDGATPLRAWFDVVLPATLPGIAVIAGFAFVNAWAEVLMVVILVTGSDHVTLPFTFFRVADASTNVQQTAALGVLYVAPALAVFLVLRRVMVSGLVESFREL
jgi:multiple sugar transport system permease protein